MALPKWTDERTASLRDFVGSESPVSQDTVSEAAEQLETTVRSVAAKLRKEGFEVESSATVASKTFTEEQENTLRGFVEDNSGNFTYAQIAEAFPGDFNAKQIQGKILSMQLHEHVKPAPQREVVRSFTEEEEATVASMAADGSYLEDIAEAIGKTINQIRGKALSMLRSGQIASIPAQRESRASAKTDPLEGVDVSGLSVEEIADQIGKTVRGVKTMLTRRGLTAANYDGAAKQAKAAG